MSDWCVEGLDLLLSQSYPQTTDSAAAVEVANSERLLTKVVEEEVQLDYSRVVCFKCLQNYQKLFHNSVTIENYRRRVILGDSIAWLKTIEKFPEKCSGFTSMPDISELQEIFGNSSNYQVDEYKTWFLDTAKLFLSKFSIGSYVIFLQSDTRVYNSNREVCQWIDKSFLCSSAADQQGYKMVWHKMVLVQDITTRSVGRPSYSHLLCYVRQKDNSGGNNDHADSNSNNSYKFRVNSCEDKCTCNPYTNLLDAKKSGKDVIAISKHTTNDHNSDSQSDKSDNQYELKDGDVSYKASLFAVPDIFERGDMLWKKGIGINCCYVGCKFLKLVANSKCIIDPFCGIGTVLCMANKLGVDSIGVELAAKRCRKSRNIIITTEQLDLIPAYLRRITLSAKDDPDLLKDSADVLADMNKDTDSLDEGNSNRCD